MQPPGRIGRSEDNSALWVHRIRQPPSEYPEGFADLRRSAMTQSHQNFNYPLNPFLFNRSNRNFPASSNSNYQQNFQGFTFRHPGSYPYLNPNFHSSVNFPTDLATSGLYSHPASLPWNCPVNSVQGQHLNESVITQTPHSTRKRRLTCCQSLVTSLPGDQVNKKCDSSTENSKTSRSMVDSEAKTDEILEKIPFSPSSVQITFGTSVSGACFRHIQVTNTDARIERNVNDTIVVFPGKLNFNSAIDAGWMNHVLNCIRSNSSPIMSTVFRRKESLEKELEVLSPLRNLGRDASEFTLARVAPDTQKELPRQRKQPREKGDILTSLPLFCPPDIMKRVVPEVADKP